MVSTARRSALEQRQDGLDPVEVLGERPAAYLDLDVGVALIEEPAQLLGQAADVVLGEVVAAARVTRDRRIGAAKSGRFGEEGVQGSTGDLGRRVPQGVPQGHVQRSHGHAPLTVPTGILAPHHGVAGPERIDGDPMAQRPCPGHSRTWGQQPPVAPQVRRVAPCRDRRPICSHRSAIARAVRLIPDWTETKDMTMTAPTDVEHRLRRATEAECRTFDPALREVIEYRKSGSLSGPVSDRLSLRRVLSALVALGEELDALVERIVAAPPQYRELRASLY
jgi:hypothetical protein